MFIARWRAVRSCHWKIPTRRQDTGLCHRQVQTDRPRRLLPAASTEQTSWRGSGFAEGVQLAGGDSAVFRDWRRSAGKPARLSSACAGDSFCIYDIAGYMSYFTHFWLSFSLPQIFHRFSQSGTAHAQADAPDKPQDKRHQRPWAAV